MVLTQEQKEKHKNILIHVFKEFISICEKHNLAYFCCGGTAIGVVRHQGIIPWDDDIDILMPRDDYEKFIAIYKDNENFELITPENNNNYYLPFIKLCDKKTTILETFDNLCIIGAFVDIFPLDGVPSDKAKRQELMHNFKVNSNILAIVSKPSKVNIKNFINRLFKFQLRTAYFELFYSFDKKNKREKILKKLNDAAKLHSFQQAEIVGNLCGMYGEREFIPKEWFKTYTSLKFENLDVRMPSEYHKYLKQIYGDYMMLPPVDKRISHHNLAYFNLDKRIDIDTIVNNYDKIK
ncbi:LicD family protein [Sphingobacteriaceae bacterium WQ 2009]|uniref:LicD family protein n=1 Tax=Rhinopithecimicrobium faecis TaxID=2820698 RepID=A0A8T4H567_9SPHI|nr:LicD family protein [Sphingobacteriaceae bacterium WQ 2009]